MLSGQAQRSRAKHLLAVALALASVSCDSQRAEDAAFDRNAVVNLPAADIAAEQGSADPLVARLAKADAALCTDPAIHELVVSQTFQALDPAAAQKHQLLLSEGGSIEFARAKKTDAEPEALTLTCSARLPNGYSDKPFAFTYTLRADKEGKLVVDEEGQRDRWFHFRWAVISQLAEEGFAPTPAVAAPPVELPEPAPEPAPPAVPEPILNVSANILSNSGE